MKPKCLRNWRDDFVDWLRNLNRIRIERRRMRLFAQGYNYATNILEAGTMTADQLLTRADGWLGNDSEHFVKGVREAVANWRTYSHRLNLVQ